MSGNVEQKTSFRELFTPKLITILSEGYDLAKFKADTLAGLTVAIVALPLSMAIAIACGTSPERGLYTAIVGGFLISLLGGSRYQIGGPAGAFIVLVVTTIQTYGYDGFLLATIIAGIIMMAIGFLRFGVYIKYIPLPVRIGFTTGIGIILLSGQIKDFLGLTLSSTEPAAVVPKLTALFEALPTLQQSSAIYTICIGMLTLSLIYFLKYMRPSWPNMLIAIICVSLITKFAHLPVETIETRFGGIPNSLPFPSFPAVSWEKINLVFPAAIAIALLGGIESLLSAVVADAMTGRRHRSNCELVAQGIANIVSALFSGLCATGTIARTTTNVRAGATGPVAGMMHSLFLLIIMLVAAPLASGIPLTALAAILITVSLNMIEYKEIILTLKRSRSESFVLLVTLFLTVFRDLTEGIAVGVVLGSLIFMHRMAHLVSVDYGEEFLADDIADSPRGEISLGEIQEDQDPDFLIYRFQGPLFFGATNTVARALERIGIIPPIILLDFSKVPLIDSSGVEIIESFINHLSTNKEHIYIVGASPSLRKTLIKTQINISIQNYFPTMSSAKEHARKKLKSEA